MADQERVIRLLAAVLAQHTTETSLPELLCRRAMATLGMDAVAATLLSTPEHRHVVFASDAEVVGIEDMQFTLGDGPVIEAYRDNRPVMVPDLPHEALSRWPMFGEASARNVGYAGVFAFPLLVGDARPIGAMGLYRREAGALDHSAVADAQVIASAVALAVVRTPEVADDLRDPEQHGEPDGGLTRWSGSEQVVYQAVGMVVAQLRLHPYEALARLRAHAFADDTTLDEVALAVIERRLRLED